MIPLAIQNQLEIYARDAAPVEACALLVSRKTGWQINKLANLARDPHASFEVDAAKLEQIAAGRKAVLFHSHPVGPSYPSHADMQGYIDTKLDWLIADISVQPAAFFTLSHSQQTDLHNRPFRHGVTDCYSLIRDYYSQVFALSLPEYPRGWHWWSEGHDYYRERFRDAGFFQLAEGAALQQGDIGLMRLRASMTNHAAIWCGDGLLFHHLASGKGFDPFRLPQYDPAERFAPFIHGWLRHHSRHTNSG